KPTVYHSPPRKSPFNSHSLLLTSHSPLFPKTLGLDCVHMKQRTHYALIAVAADEVTCKTDLRRDGNRSTSRRRDFRRPSHATRQPRCHRRRISGRIEGPDHCTARR